MGATNIIFKSNFCWTSPKPCGIVLRCKEVQHYEAQKTTSEETTVLPGTLHLGDAVVLI